MSLRNAGTSLGVNVKNTASTASPTRVRSRLDTGIVPRTLEHDAPLSALNGGTDCP